MTHAIPTSLLVLATITTGLASVSLLPGTIQAQTKGDYLFRKDSAATLGKTLKLSLQGMPANRGLVWMLSLNGGPTPLISLIGQDTRSVAVGVDLVTTWQFLGTGTGSVSLNVPVPTLAVLQGQHIHMQTLTLTSSGPRIVDKISNPIVVVPCAAGSSTKLLATLSSARAMSNAFLNPKLSDSGGDVVLAGGGVGTDIFDFHTLSVRKGPNMVLNRSLNTYTVLKDGRVLIAGGIGVVGTTPDALTHCEIYDPVKNTFSKTGDLTSKRAGHGAALLADGRVLVVGGINAIPPTELTKLLSFLATGLKSSAEIYDPAKGTWSKTSSIRNKSFAPTLVTLKDGKTLVCGGVVLTSIFGIPTGLVSTKTCERFDPKSDKWSSAASMKVARTMHGPCTVLMPDGRVLSCGGVSVNFTLTKQSIDTLADAEAYDPVKNTWVAQPKLAANSTGHVATVVPDGRVFVTGVGAGRIVQAFDPKQNTWTRLKDMQQPRSGHAALVTPDGVLTLFGPTTSMEIIHP